MWPLEGIACLARRLLFVAFETCLLFVTIGIGLELIGWTAGDPSPGDQHTFMLALGLAVVCQTAFYYTDLYGPLRMRPSLHVAERMFRALGLVALAIAVWSMGLPHYFDDGAAALLVALTFPLLVIPVSRHRYPALMKLAGLSHRVLVLGDGPLAHTTVAEIDGRPELGYQIVGMLRVDAAAMERQDRPDSSLTGLPALVQRERVDIVTVALEDRRKTIPLAVRLACRSAGVTMVDVDEFYQRVTGRVLSHRFTPSMVIDGCTPPRRVAAAIKRLVDVLVAGLLLVLLAPILALVALLVKSDSPGPILYSQERIGLRGRVFRLYKFRSMRLDAEAATGPVWAADRDPRVTRVGRFLRSSRLDECPQLWNVIKGDMSLVGPRPERPVFVERLSREVPSYAQRHLLLPGVTGWAQVCYPYGASVEDARAKLTYDLYYLLHWSPAFDLLIIFHTIKIVLCGRGAR